LPEIIHGALHGIAIPHRCGSEAVSACVGSGTHLCSCWHQSPSLRHTSSYLLRRPKTKRTVRQGTCVVCRTPRSQRAGLGAHRPVKRLCRAAQGVVVWRTRARGQVRPCDVGVGGLDGRKVVGKSLIAQVTAQPYTPDPTP